MGLGGGVGGKLYNRTGVAFLKYVPGDTKSIWLHCQSVSDPQLEAESSGSLSFSQNIYDFQKQSEVFWVWGCEKDPCTVSF